MLKDSQIQLDFNSFYNTIQVSGSEHEELEYKAKSLEEFILVYVFKNSSVEYSPYDVLEICKQLKYPTKENSVRRALTNLKDHQTEWELKLNRSLMLTGKQVVNLKYSKVKNATYKIKWKKTILAE